MTKDEFLQLVTPAAQASSALSGFPPGVAVAQAALESAWGGSRLSQVANNYFGIKAARGASSIALSTNEYIAGESGPPTRPGFGRGGVVEMRRVVARFARYPSVEACFIARDRILLTAACYAEARGHAREPVAFIHSLAKYWATDPAYAEKLEQIYLQNHFADLDQAFACRPERSEGPLPSAGISTPAKQQDPTPAEKSGSPTRSTEK